MVDWLCVTAIIIHPWGSSTHFRSITVITTMILVRTLTRRVVTLIPMKILLHFSRIYLQILTTIWTWEANSIPTITIKLYLFLLLSFEALQYNFPSLEILTHLLNHLVGVCIYFLHTCFLHYPGRSVLRYVGAKIALRNGLLSVGIIHSWYGP